MMAPKSLRRLRSCRRGFSLVEMLVVLAILGLLIGLVSPFVAPREGQDLRTLAHAVAADLRLLRDEAIRHSATTRFALAEGGYVLRPSGRAKPLPARLWPDTEYVIDFFPDGSSTGGVLSLVRNGSTARIVIRAFDGHVQLHDRN
jgi:general secretion pathway protein H